jgi:hypothetical protein
MILDILSAINGRIKFILQGKEYYFIEEFTILNDKISFVDACDGKSISLSYEEVGEASINTYGSNTIPNRIQIDGIKRGDTSFFDDNEQPHALSNREFDRCVSTSKKYIEFFGIDDVDFIKSCVVDDDTVHLERLKILGCNKIIQFHRMETHQGVYIRELYWNLIEAKLHEAISEIDNSIAEIDDEEFKEEAEIIKKDLSDNVWEFRSNLRGVSSDKLFNHWPTLLNPSPFSGLE